LVPNRVQLHGTESLVHVSTDLPGLQHDGKSEDVTDSGNGVQFDEFWTHLHPPEHRTLESINLLFQTAVHPQSRCDRLCDVVIGHYLKRRVPSLFIFSGLSPSQDTKRTQHDANQLQPSDGQSRKFH
jgi:hypothetical protein